MEADCSPRSTPAHFFLAEGGGIEPHWLSTSPPLSKRFGGHSPAPSVATNLVLEERFELSRTMALVSKTSVFTSYTTPAWSTVPDSNRIRAGLQSAASTASAFGAQNVNKPWLGRKDSNLRLLGSEPSAVAAVPLPSVPIFSLVAGAGIGPASLPFQSSAFT